MAVPPEVTGPGKQESQQIVAERPVKPWVHFVAGGLAGMVGAIVTSPLDVIKTRMQSDMYRTNGNHNSGVFRTLANIYRTEGAGALFSGLGANLSGVVPARAVNFFTYGICKQLYAPLFDDAQCVKPQTHLLAGASAGFATSAVTNPIWLVKTRMQLDRHRGAQLYRNSFDCAAKIVRYEGVPALYRGLSASLVGSSESSMQWLLYEQMRRFIRKSSQRNLERELLSSPGNHIGANSEFSRKKNKFIEWMATSGAAGCAKLCASLITYPHEVVRTRLRQAPLENGQLKYKGLVSCFKRVYLEEGFAALYGGLTPHLLRTVPNSIILFGTWDLLVRVLSR